MSQIDEILDLPEDPELAFVVFEKQQRKELWGEIDLDTSASSTLKSLVVTVPQATSTSRSTIAPTSARATARS